MPCENNLVTVSILVMVLGTYIRPVAILRIGREMTQPTVIDAGSK